MSAPFAPPKLGSPGVVPLVLATRFNPDNQEIVACREGATIWDMVEPHLAVLPADLQADAVVTLITERGLETPYRAVWKRARPAAGATVHLSVPLMKGGVLKIILTIAILASAAFLGPLAAGALGFATTGLVAAGISGLISVIGGMLVNKLFSEKPPSANVESDRKFTISGTRNPFTPFGRVPEPHGDIRIFPPMLARPWTESIGRENYVRCVYLLGLEPFDFDDYRFGATPAREDVEIDVRTLNPGDVPSLIYCEPCFEDEPNIELRQEDGWHTVRGPTNVIEGAADDVFDALVRYTEKKGKKRETDVTVAREYRNARDDGQPWTALETLTHRDDTEKPFVKSQRWIYPELGQYDVRTKRVTEDRDSRFHRDKVTLGKIRSFRPVSLANFSVPVKLATVRIRAGTVWSGLVDQFNGMAHAVRPDWDEASGTWITRRTQSPAAAFRRVCQGPGNFAPASDAEMALAAIEDWSEHCRTLGLKYNAYIDYDIGVEDLLKEIASAGRASPARPFGKRSVIVDRPQTIRRGLVTSRNAADFSGAPIAEEIPDGLRCKFLDETDLFRATERVVYRPGVDPAAAKSFLVKEFPYTDPDLVMRAALRWFAERLARKETLFATVGRDHKLCPRGSLVGWQVPIVKTQRSARVLHAQGRAIVLDEAVEQLPGLAYGLHVRSKSGAHWVLDVQTIPGTSRMLVLDHDGQLPELDDLVAFGPRETAVMDVVITEVEKLANLRARLTAIAHAPELDRLADDGPRPPWFPITPWTRPFIDALPLKPRILSVTSGSETLQTGEDDEEITEESVVVVKLAPGAGDDLAIDTYIVRVERDGEDDIERPFAASLGRAEFFDFAPGEALTITAVARSFYGKEGPRSDEAAHTVAARDDLPPDVTSASVVRLSDGRRLYTWAFDDPDGDVAGTRIYVRPGEWSSLSDLEPVYDGLIPATMIEISEPFSTGLHTFGFVTEDAEGEISKAPYLIRSDLGPSFGPGLLLQRLESALNWPGVITGAIQASGGLQGGAGLPSSFSYVTPAIDLGAEQMVDVAPVAYGAAGDVTLAMRVGLAVDGGPAGAALPPGVATARFVEITVTVTNDAAAARLGDLVTIVTPA